MSELQELDSLTGREIAVIGLAGRFPAARNLKEYWQNLRGGIESVTFLTNDDLLAAGVEPQHLDPSNGTGYVKAASLLEDVDLFDASFFGYNAREAEILDPQQRLFLEEAWHALEDAGYAPQDYEGLIGVYAGAAWNTYLLSNLTSHRELFDGGGGFQIFIASDKDFMPTRVAYKFNLKGPGLIIQTSCSTSLVAVHLACLSLLNYECDIALAGGVTVKVPQKTGYFYQEGGLASPDGHCRPFDANAAGTVFGSGVGVVVLKRLSEALENGDCIRAIIKASAINNDGSAKVSYTAPGVEGQAGVIAAAQAMAGFEPETIRYIEAHGTGTSLGDPVEIAALTKVFRRHTDRKGFCAIGSVKSNVGHLDAAAGIAGFIKTALALEHEELPPSINFETPNPSIDFSETPFYVNSQLTAWERHAIPRRAAVSSFGVGGTNAHVILEEAPLREPSGPSRRWQLLVFSVKTASALDSSIDNFRNWLRENEEFAFPDAAYTLKVGRTVFRHRCALVCRDREDAARAFETPNCSRLLKATDQEDLRDRPIVFMFPGQGSQYLRMAEELYELEAGFRIHFDECAKLLKPHLGFELQDMLYPKGDGDEGERAARIEETSLAQPILFTIEYALARVWMEWGVKPAAMIGHSIGEYVAACLAGVLSLEDALKIVAIRGRLMQRQPRGNMLAVSLSEEELFPLLPPEISLAAINEPSGSVISGPPEIMAKFEDELSARGRDFRRLHTSHAFHSAMMDPILETFGKEMRRIHLDPPRIPFISNLTGAWITAEQATNPNYWVSHLRETVRFSKGLKELLSDPDRIFLEVGPGRALTTLARRHPEGQSRVMISSLRHPKEDLSDMAALLEGLGRLWLAGVKVDWRGFYKNERRQRAPLPLYPFERRRFWIEPKARPARGDKSAEVQSAATEKTNLPEWFYLPAWRPQPLPKPTGETEGSWLVMAGRRSFGKSLADHLAEQGQEVVTVEMGESFRRQSEKAYTIRPGFSEDYHTLLSDLQKQGSLPRMVVHAFSLTQSLLGANTSAEFEAFQEQGFYSLLFLLQALMQYPQERFNLAVLTNGALATMAEDPPLSEKAPMLGLCKVAAQESTNITPKFIDLPLPDFGASPGHLRLLDSIISEIKTESTDLAVAYRGGRRWAPGFEPLRLAEDADLTPLRERGTYLIIGGLSGDGYGFAKYLARAVKARLILVEDAQLRLSGALNPDAQLQTLKELGVDVCLMGTDLTDPEQLRRVWNEGEARFGSIHGLIHAGGLQGEGAFRTISEAGREDCERHFRSKAHVLYAIESVLKEKDIDFCVLLSSIASVLGGVGYGPYAAANLFLDSFAARSNRTNRTPWLSLNWDLWLGEDRSDQITEVRGDLSALAMTAGEGEEAFRRALSVGGVDQILVSTTDLSARLLSVQHRLNVLRSRRETEEGPGAETDLHPRPPLPNQYVAPETEMERRLIAVWQQVLGFEPIGVEDNFFDLGGDSLIAIKMASRLKQELGMDFPVAKLYQGVTVRTLAQLLNLAEGEEQAQLAAQFAEHKQTLGRRRAYIEHRRSGMREGEE